MKHQFAVRRFLLPLLGAALLGGALRGQEALAQAASAPAAASGQAAAIQRVMDDLARGKSAAASLKALGATTGVSPATDNGRDTEQMRTAQSSLRDGLDAYLAGKLGLEALRNRYDVWNAAGLVFSQKIQSQGARLTGSPDAAAHLARHRAVQEKITVLFTQVRTALDPVLQPGAKAVPTEAQQRQAALAALALLRAVPEQAGEVPILRAQPVPVGGLDMAPRKPVLSPVVVPSYESATEVTPASEDRAATSYASLDDEILAKANALNNDYVRIYEFVRNSIRNEWYGGSVKGALGTLRSGAGNDIDQASLLTALLRGAGLNTRFVQGVVEVPLERLAAEIGLPTSQAASVPLALSKAGLAYSTVARGGKVVAVQLGRTWVSAYVPYTNYRGALVDASGKSWIPLDPFYKTYTVRASTGLFAKTFTAAGLSQDFLARDRGVSFHEFVRSQVGAAVSNGGGEGGWEAQRSTVTSDALQLDILPNSLPYATVAVTREGAELPAADIGTVRIRVQQGNRADDVVVLDKTLPLSAVTNARLSLSYGPATTADHRVALLYGGMDSVPLYLIGLRPELKLGGDSVALASDKVDAGNWLRLRVTLEGPWGSQEVEQSVMAGAYQALVIGNDPQRPETIPPSDGDRQGIRLLDGLGVHYQQRWNEADRDLAGWLDSALLRPVPAVTLVSTQMKPAQFAGASMTLDWTGVSLDAALRPVDGVGTRVADALSLSALAGSSLEQQVFRDQFQVEAVSADRAQQVAREQGVGVLSLTASSINQLDGTNHSDTVKAAVKDLVRQGFEVRIPAQTVTLRDWRGSAWQATQGSRSGFFLSGGLAGGNSAQAPGTWTLKFLEDAFKSMETDNGLSDPMAGHRVLALGATDGQRVEVDKDLPLPFMVKVVDKDGVPVAGAKVTFAVVTGDAQVGGGTTAVASTDVHGIASATVHMGKDTSQNSIFVMKNESDVYSTQAGLVSVDAMVESYEGLLRPQAPLTAVLMPGPLSQLPFRTPPPTEAMPAESAGGVDIGTQDRFGNPVSNVTVQANMIGVPNGTCTTGAPNQFRPGAVWNRSTAEHACEGGVVLGQCGQASVSMTSGSNGAVFLGMIANNEVGASNQVKLSSGGISGNFSFRTSGACSPGQEAVTYWLMGQVDGYIADSEGNILNAAKPGAEAPGPLQVRIYQSKWSYHLVNGKAIFDPYVSWEETTGNVTSVTLSNGGNAALNGKTISVTVAPQPAAHTLRMNLSGQVKGVRNENDVAVNFTDTLSLSMGGGEPTFFSVKPTITSITSRGAGGTGADPEQIFLDRDGLSLYPIDINYKVEPPEFKMRKGSWRASLMTDNQITSYIAGNNTQGPGVATLPRAQPFDQDHHQYTAQVTAAFGLGLESEIVKLPLRQKLLTDVRAGRASRFVDLVNQRSCDVSAMLTFTLARAASVKVSYRYVDALGSPSELIPAKDYPAGTFSVELDSNKISDGEAVIIVEAVASADASVVDSETTNTSVAFRMANSLPVGQTLVQGLNVRSGILTQQTQPLQLRGRGPGLGLVFTYSSSGAGQVSTAGANWVHNHDMGLTINSCGEVMVSAGDSGTVRFTPQDGYKMKPEKGYHGTLIANEKDSSWDFYSKDGTQYHYKMLTQRTQWKLDYVKDRSGNTLTYAYDLTATPEPLVSTVTHSDGRRLEFVYTKKLVRDPSGKVTARDLLTQVRGTGDNLAQADYDELGNLVSYSVNGRQFDYAYDVDAGKPMDRYSLLKATDAKGDVTSFEYGVTPVSMNTGSTTLRFAHPFVKTIHTALGGALKLSIDTVNWKSSQLVHEPGGTTSYTFNAYGSPLSIQDEAGTTTMTWADDDVLMKTKQDARGVTSSYGYDEHGNLLSETVDGKTASFTYEVQTVAPFSKSRMTSRRDRNGNKFGYGLDGAGRVLTETLPIGQVTHTYASNGDRLSSTDPNGHQTLFSYDNFGSLTATQLANGARLVTERDARGRVVSSTDGNGHTTTFKYDNQDNLLGQSNPDGTTRAMSYDGMGNKTQETDENGRITSTTYGKGSLPKTVTMTGMGSGGATKTFSWDGAGNKLSETDWNGQVTSFAYDAVYRLKTRTEPMGKVTTYDYDPVGNLLSETVGNRTTTHAYDGLNRRKQTTDAEGGVWITEYDNNGNATAKQDALTRRTVMEYDGMNRLLSKTEPLGKTTSFGYDSVGNKTSATDALGRTTQFTYDTVNRLTKTDRPDGTSEQVEYDKANNVIRETDAGGGITQHSYDSRNRRESTKDPEGNTTQYQYDGLGNVLSETWANGNVQSHRYDLFLRRTSTTDAVGLVREERFDNNGNLLSERDGNGNQTTHEYDLLNHRTATHLTGGRELKFKPDVFGNIEETTDARGNVTAYTYDKLDRALSTKFPDGGEVKSTFDPVGNVLTKTDPRGKVTTTTYDDLNRPVTVRDPLGNTTATTYDKVGNALSQTDKRGTETLHTFDSMNRRLTTVKAGVTLDTSTYNALGKVATQLDANGNKTLFTYDKRGLLVATTAADGAVTQLALDSMGDVTVATDPMGRKTRTPRDERRRVKSTTNGAGETTVYGYDANNNRVVQTEPLGNSVSYEFDERNWLVKVTEPEGRATQYARDDNGNLIKVTDGEGRWMSFSYDKMNRRSAITYPDGASQSFVYDTAGNLKTHTDALGVKVTREFDDLSRETSRAFSASADGLESIATAYDANGNALSVTEKYTGAAARVTTRTYDAFDRPKIQSDGYGASMAFGYDLNGNRLELSTQDGKLTRYGYDGLNRLTGLTSPAGKVQYGYDKSGLVLQRTFGNGTGAKIVWDDAARQKQIALTAGVKTLNLTEYTYDANGNRLTERINRPHALSGAQVTTYSYDRADRLTGTQLTRGADTVVTSWTYDKSDNRLTEAVTRSGANAGSENRSYTYDNRSQLKTIADSAMGQTVLDYDAQGNLVRKVRGSDTTVYGWSARDLLTSVSRNGTELGRYGSDYTGMRVTKEAVDPASPNAGKQLRLTQWDAENALQDRDGGGAVVSRYDFAKHQAVAMWSQDDGAQLLHADALGSIVATTAADGTLKSETVYDAWGNPVEKAGFSRNKFAYTGHQADAETGLYYFKARYYDPETGRFISQDPAEGKDLEPASYQRYLYAYANPLAYVDPDGRQTVANPAACANPMFLLCAAMTMGGQGENKPVPRAPDPEIPAFRERSLFERLKDVWKSDSAETQSGSPRYLSDKAAEKVYNAIRQEAADKQREVRDAKSQSEYEAKVAELRAIAQRLPSVAEGRWWMRGAIWTPIHEQAAGVTIEGKPSAGVELDARLPGRQIEQAKRGTELLPGKSAAPVDQGALPPSMAIKPAGVNIIVSQSEMDGIDNGGIPEYAERIRTRAVQDPGGHNFPHSLDRAVLSVEPVALRNDGKGYALRGYKNDSEVVYNIIVRDGKIVHRDLVSVEKWDKRAKSFDWPQKLEEIQKEK